MDVGEVRTAIKKLLDRIAGEVVEVENQVESPLDSIRYIDQAAVECAAALKTAGLL